VAQSKPAADAASYPDRPVRVVVPYAPGGSSDAVARILSQKLTESLGQQFVIDNRPGAAGSLGREVVVRASPDGHTLLVNNISLAVNQTLYAKLPYDVRKDLGPVSLLGRQPNVVVVYPGAPSKTMRELIELARAKPNQIQYGSGGVGTASHLATAMLELATGASMVHVPYKGLGPALTDLMAGRIQIIISTLASALPQINAGKLRPLAVTTAQRSTFFPSVPTMDEAGVKDYEFSTWYGLLVAPGTPNHIVAQLNRETRSAVESPTVKEQFARQGLEAGASSADEFRRFLVAEVAKWGKVIKASGATAQ